MGMHVHGMKAEQHNVQHIVHGTTGKVHHHSTAGFSALGQGMSRFVLALYSLYAASFPYRFSCDSSSGGMPAHCMFISLMARAGHGKKMVQLLRQYAHLTQNRGGRW